MTRDHDASLPNPYELFAGVPRATRGRVGALAEYWSHASDATEPRARTLSPRVALARARTGNRPWGDGITAAAAR